MADGYDPQLIALVEHAHLALAAMEAVLAEYEQDSPELDALALAHEGLAGALQPYPAPDAD